MTTLVTGATGFVGNNVARSLLNRGESVRVLVREGSDPRPLEGVDVEIVHGDIRDREALTCACEGVDYVVHAAASIHIGWTGIESQREVNVEGSHNVAVAARLAGAKLVHVSSVDALRSGSRDRPADEEPPFEGKVPCTYVVTKREAERAVLAEIDRGLHATIVNPGFMLGPWDWKPSSGRMLLEVARRFMPLAPSGGCSVCDVRDVAAGIIAARELGECGRRYVLGGHNTSYLELWRHFARVSRSRAPWRVAGPLASFIAGRCGDIAGRFTRREPEINSAMIAMSRQFHYYTSDRAERELGYRVRGLEISVADAWDWFRQYGYV